MGILAVFMGLTGCTKGNEAVSKISALETEKETEEQEEDMTTESELVVYVCGCVVRPGVYLLKQGDRICDAIDAAGGMAADAAVDYWNLAQFLEDGMKIMVPSYTQVEEMNLPSEMNTNSSDGKININKADKAALMELPGIGSTRAEQILKYRKENGNFSGVEEIKKVPGIKDSVYSMIEEYITVDD